MRNTDTRIGNVFRIWGKRKENIAWKSFKLGDLTVNFDPKSPNLSPGGTPSDVWRGVLVDSQGNRMKCIVRCLSDYALKSPYADYYYDDFSNDMVFYRQSGVSPRLLFPEVFYDQSDNNRPYMILEDAGITIQDLIEAKEYIPFETIVQIALRTAELLDNLHGQNMRHRDLKPANVAIGHINPTKQVSMLAIAPNLSPLLLDPMLVPDRQGGGEGIGQETTWPMFYVNNIANTQDTGEAYVESFQDSVKIDHYGLLITIFKMFSRTNASLRRLNKAGFAQLVREEMKSYENSGLFREIADRIIFLAEIYDNGEQPYSSAVKMVNFALCLQEV